MVVYGVSRAGGRRGGKKGSVGRRGWLEDANVTCQRPLARLCSSSGYSLVTYRQRKQPGDG